MPGYMRPGGRPLMVGRQQRVEHRPLFDSVNVLAAANPNPQPYFAPRQGANEYQTSLKSDGRISGNNLYAVEAIRVIPEPAEGVAVPADTVQLITSFFVLELDGVRMAQFHAFDLPAGVGMTINADQGGIAAATAMAVAHNGVAAISNIRELRAPFGIEPNEEFVGRLTFAAVPAMTAARRLFIMLDGQEQRPR